MEFELTDEQELIRDSVAKLCGDFPDEYWSEKDTKHEFPWDFYNTMAAAGWLGIAIPEAYGGSGRGITEASLVLETVAASGAAMNGATPLHLSIFGMEPVVKFGSEEMKQKYLPRVAKGDLHVAFGVTEPDAGTDTSSITTAARLDGDHYMVKGRKVWTTKALESERVLLLVRTTAKDKIENFKNHYKELTQIKEIVDEAMSILQSPSVPIESLGKLLHESWKLKRSLSVKVSTPYIDEIYEAGIKSGAIGGKILGAGGGGFILFFAKPENHKNIRSQLKDLVHVSFRFDNIGSKIVVYEPNGFK